MKQSKTDNSKKPNHWLRIFLIVATAMVLLIVAGVFTVRRTYEDGLKPVSSSNQTILFTVPKGASVKETAQSLEQEGLIRSSRSFEWYFRTNNLREYLKAGTYNLRPSLSAQEIAGILTEGRIATGLITILPGQRIDQIKNSLINDYGFNEAAVEAALKPSAYPNHPALVDKPKNAGLEGYLYPESFQNTSQTTPKSVIEASLDQMAAALTPEVRQGINEQGLSIYEGIKLASIIEREVGHADNQKDLEDKKIVAQVFLRRLRGDIPLQSDATASYGAVLAGRDLSTMPKAAVLRFESPYNTYLHKDLTPTPISNVSTNSLKAVAAPAKTNYLYFLSDDNCVTRFSMTLEEHEANISKYLTSGCGS